MLCVRCSHTLAPRADRCLRCFALNPQNHPAPIARAVHSDPDRPAHAITAELRPDGPVAPLSMSIASDPPAPVALAARVAIPDTVPDPVHATLPPAPIATARDSHDAVTDPPDREPPRALPAAPAISAHGPDWLAVLAPSVSIADRPRTRARLLAWSIDLALLGACAAGHLLLATAVIGPSRLAPHGSGSPDYWLDLLLTPRLPLLWVATAACLALAYSWLFAALGGRTPGMAIARLRLVTVEGKPLTPMAALTRAALSLASAAAGLAGFALALFDPRGQTLHDKLARTVVVTE